MEEYLASPLPKARNEEQPPPGSKEGAAAAILEMLC